ncbi:MAG: cation:proton antiporter [Chloroflexi bacterium]|nr:MAG: cation:proton antiporter [Chloroflexota bacterium]
MHRVQGPAHRPEHPVARRQSSAAPGRGRRCRGAIQTDRSAGRQLDRRPAPSSLPGARGTAPLNVPTDLLSSIGICVGAAALIAAVTWRFRQPLIIAYLATGVIIGPRIGLKFITNEDSIQTVAEIGLILLLFVIGLEIDLRKMASGGLAVLLTGALQVPICIALGLGFFAVVGVTNSQHNSRTCGRSACSPCSRTS